MNNLVTIITPSYNSSKYIRKTIESVLTQSYQNWEMIIIDDYSLDNTNIIIEKYIKNDSRIKFIKLKKNIGPSLARNIGIKECSGKYLTFLDSDDFWEIDFIKESLYNMNKYNIHFTYSSYFRKNEDLSKDFGVFNIPGNLNYFDLLKTNSISCLTAFIDLNYFGKTYMKNKGHEDYILWLELLKKTNYAYGIKKPLATYRIRKGSLSRNKFKVIKYQWIIYREIEKLNIFKSLYYFFNYIYFGLKKNL